MADPSPTPRCGGPAWALNAKIAVLGSAFFSMIDQSGVDATGATKCASAIPTALDVDAMFGFRLSDIGIFEVAWTVPIAGTADLGGACFICIGPKESLSVSGR